MVDTMGRRERKKAVTRKAISDAATLLFLERGFDEVSIREVAERADVSPTTVFAHFPQKEALVFDEDEEQREQIVAAVRDRPAGVSASQALHALYREGLLSLADDHGEKARLLFMDFINRTPALRDYAARMWVRHEDALAAVLAEEAGLAEPSTEIRVYARFVLQIQVLATWSSDTAPDIDAAFRILDGGWDAYAAWHPGLGAR
ncbi:MAG: TetR family transcriptional regulator [Leifsonia xyli]|nr:MAG: TetR family transcriptional regulator [Leifsonia xyli]